MNNVKEIESLKAFRSFVGNSETFDMKDYFAFKPKAKELGIIQPRFLLKNNVAEKLDRSTWIFPKLAEAVNETSNESSVASLVTVSSAVEKTEEVSLATNVIEFPKNETETYVPAKVGEYVKFGHFNDVKIISSILRIPFGGIAEQISF